MSLTADSTKLDLVPAKASNFLITHRRQEAEVSYPRAGESGELQGIAGCVV